MKKNVVGYRFDPTEEELIKHYLKNKILGKTWLVDDAIREINICSHDPVFLPRLSKIKSNDHVWYFFSLKEYTSAKEKAMKRMTSSGYWKPTGKDRKIKDKRGNGVEIGIKKTLVYYEGRVSKGVRTDWVMHEYHITCLPNHQRSYVICKVFYKGEVGDISSSGNNSSEPSHSLVSDSDTVKVISTSPEVEQVGQDNSYGLSTNNNFTMPMNEQEDLWTWDVLDSNRLFNDNNNDHNMQLQAPYLVQDDDEFMGGLKHVNQELVEYLFSNEEFY